MNCIYIATRSDLVYILQKDPLALEGGTGDNYNKSSQNDMVILP